MPKPKLIDTYSFQELKYMSEIGSIILYNFLWNDLTEAQRLDLHSKISTFNILAQKPEYAKPLYEDDYPAFDSKKIRDTAVSVTGDRSYQAAMRLHKDNPGAKIAVMNFANAFHAGGGVAKGCSAQEECLCRTSTLYPLARSRSARIASVNSAANRSFRRPY